MEWMVITVFYHVVGEPAFDILVQETTLRQSSDQMDQPGAFVLFFYQTFEALHVIQRALLADRQEELPEVLLNTDSWQACYTESN